MYLRFLLCVLCLLPHSWAMASYSISPVRLYLKAEDKLTTLNISNGNDTEATFQLAIYKWTRVNGEDVYTESKDLLVTPVVFSFAPDKTQLIRIAQRHNTAIKTEQSYRLFLKEVPSRQSSENNAVNVVLQFGVPIFLMPAKSNSGDLKCNLSSKEDKLKLRCKNTHNLHVLVTALQTSDDEFSPNEIRMSQYFFPNEERTLTLDKPADLSVHNFHLISFYEGKRVKTPLTLE
jgi:fimbrial chaperone protein